MGHTIPKLSVELIIGGGSKLATDTQIAPHIIVGTIDRMLKCITQGEVDVTHLKMFVFDEADELSINPKRLDTLVQIKYSIPPTAQTAIFRFHFPLFSVRSFITLLPLLFFSIQMNETITGATRRLLSNSVNILSPPDAFIPPHLKQFYIAVSDNTSKLPTLRDRILSPTSCQSVIFCRSKPTLLELQQDLPIELARPVSLLSSDLAQPAITEAMNDFRADSSAILVASDFFARTLSIPGVKIFINYEGSMASPENYLRRLQCAARSLPDAIVITLITPAERKAFNSIQTSYPVNIPELPPDISTLLL